MGFTDMTFGSILVGSWINSMLFMLEILMISEYFRKYKRDPITIRVVVCFALLFDIATTAADCAGVYLYCITHWGDTAYEADQPWPFPTYIMFTTLSAITVQGFLINRYFMLSNNKFIATVLGLMSVSSLAGGFASAIMLFRSSAYSSRATLVIPVTIWLAVSAATDCAIAVCLVMQLFSMKSHFRKTQSLIKRMSINAFQTGSSTSAIAVITLAFYLANKQSNVPTAFGYNLGHTYTLTMMYNLNTRPTRKAFNDTRVNGTLATAVSRTDGQDVQTDGDVKFAHIYMGTTNVKNLDRKVNLRQQDEGSVEDSWNNTISIVKAQRVVSEV